MAKETTATQHWAILCGHSAVPSDSDEHQRSQSLSLQNPVRGRAESFPACRVREGVYCAGLDSVICRGPDRFTWSDVLVYIES